MLFNSYEFILAFLPLTVAGFFVLGKGSRTWALSWLILASLFFYAWWRPLNVLIIAPSILVNYVLARILQRLGEDEKRHSASRAVLILGIAFNIAFLGYFKYINFAATATNDLFGTNFILTEIILPLGISFITFQKIAFLIDVHAKRVTSFALQDFFLFVLFFPQLIAGPIVHYREMMPQFHNASCRFDKENVSVGLTLFFMGLFKKVVIADQLAIFVTPIYEQAAAGHSVSFLFAWVAGIGFTLQIYFDFSGYTDMALGAARLFGIRLPPNFNSPLRASSIIDFWLRWHMTLTRFLTAYLYNPLALALTRHRLGRGLPAFGGHNSTAGAFFQLLAAPTLLTMLVSGIWHGAGYPFIVWGLLHGVYLTGNHAWRIVAHRLWTDKKRYARIMGPIGLVITFMCVSLSMVFFRSPTLGTGIDIVQGMAGMNGITLPTQIYDRLGFMSGALQFLGVTSESTNNLEITKLGLWILGPMLIALACPNSMQILARFEPALGFKPPAAVSGQRKPRLAWTPTLPWAVAISGIVIAGIMALGGPSEFLYWQF